MFNVVTETSETHVDKTERKRGAVVKLQQSRNSGKCYMFSLRCLDLQPKEVRSELSEVYGGDSSELTNVFFPVIEEILMVAISDERYNSRRGVWG